VSDRAVHELEEARVNWPMRAMLPMREGELGALERLSIEPTVVLRAQLEALAAADRAEHDGRRVAARPDLHLRARCAPMPAADLPTLRGGDAGRGASAR
jgi:hypothetical protein